MSVPYGSEATHDARRFGMNGGCILQVADYSAAFFSNFLSSLLRLDRAVRTELGLESVLVLPQAARNRPWIRTVTDAGIPVEFLERNASHGYRTRSLRAFGRAHGARLYHSHFGTFDVDVTYAAVRQHAPVVWHMHSPFQEWDTARQRLGERLKFTVLPGLFVARIIAVSPSVADSAIRHGAPASRFSVVLNGIDVERAHPLAAQGRTALRTEHGIAEDDLVFVLLGWSPERKGVDLFAKAIGSLASRLTGSIRGLVVSGEANEDELRRLVEDVPTIQVIRPFPDVADLYGLADCFVSASRAEGLPYAVGEAMAAGLPIVSSNLPQVVAAYGPAGPGFRTFRTGDAQELARVLSEIATIPADARHSAGESNRAFVISRLSLEGWTADMVRVYRSVLGPR